MIKPTLRANLKTYTSRQSKPTLRPNRKLHFAPIQSYTSRQWSNLHFAPVKTFTSCQLYTYTSRQSQTYTSPQSKPTLRANSNLITLRANSNLHFAPISKPTPRANLNLHFAPIETYTSRQLKNYTSHQSWNLHFAQLARSVGLRRAPPLPPMGAGGTVERCHSTAP